MSGGKINWLIEGVGKGPPAVDLTHSELAGGEKRPEEHRCGFRRGQHGLGLDASLEFLVQPLDRIGGARALPLARRQPRESEEAVAGFLQAVGYRPTLHDEHLSPERRKNGD